MPLPIYTVSDIRAIETRFLPETEPSLMERAGRSAAALALKIIAERPGPALVVCGPGNNGGDGFVVARELLLAGREVIVAFAGEAERLPEDAARAHAQFVAEGGTILNAPSGLPTPNEGWALIVDALFGIGLQRPIEGCLATLINALNAINTPILAIDAPSGLDADTGRQWGTSIHATHTATFIAAKPGLLTLDGPDCCGEISVFDLGIDRSLALAPSGHLIAPSLFASRLRPRTKNAHKGLYGDAGVLGGAPGMAGAVLLAARAALHLGTGRVYACFTDTLPVAVDLMQPELMLRQADHLPERLTALAVGPGLGVGENARQQLQSAIDRNIPLLIDADGLNILARCPDLAHALHGRQAPTLLTPHPAEAARLLDTQTAAVQADRLNTALELATLFSAHVALKGAGTIVASPDGRWFINTTGNAGMSSAGMGDVLSGLTLALLAQGWSAEEALIASVHLHGSAADLLVSRGIGPAGLTASETIIAAREVFNTWIGPI